MRSATCSCGCPASGRRFAAGRRRRRRIAPCERELKKLALYLRDHRGRAGLNYKELALRSGFSASTLIRAASGEQMPRLKTVRAYALACGADPDEAERLWKRARYRAARGCQEPVPRPRYIRNFAELHAVLADLYQKDCARPYRELEAASGGVLAHATVGRFLRQEGGRPTRQFVQAFALVCGAKGMALREWEQAWDRAEEQRMGGTLRPSHGAGPPRSFLRAAARCSFTQTPSAPRPRRHRANPGDFGDVQVLPCLRPQTVVRHRISAS
ncbi:helix-turn-helix domain-containing protein [Streptomyces sp. NPDC059474]|uniref:helix-turn-helix domain-containing protein n=1 Tax=Streptomyces sp. NPDC059474 TaxID=3346846 RepID=UPI0036A9DCC6